MHHLSFQLLDVTKVLNTIDENRYTPPTGAVKPITNGEYDNPENILNRLSTLGGTAQLGFGCAIGYILESYKFNDLVNNINQFDFYNDNLFSFHEFYDPSMFCQCISSIENFNNIGGKTSIFSLPLDSYFFKGVNIQLGDTIDLNGKSSKNDFGPENSVECFNAYIDVALNAVSNSDMEEDKKNILLRDLKLLKSGNNEYIPSEEFLQQIGGNYTVYHGQTAGPRLVSSFWNPTAGQYETSIYSSFNSELLKSINLDEGYLENNLQFKLYALFVSFGEEGIDDNCTLMKTNLGSPSYYETIVPETADKANVSVIIETLPKNRVNVKYTIKAVPDGTNSISFKVNY